MEGEIKALTEKLGRQCVGQGAGVVIGTALNMIMSASQMIPDPAVRDGLAMSFRHIAESLETQNSGVRQ